MNPPPDNDPQDGPPNKNPWIGRREIGAILLPDVSVRTRQRIDDEMRRIVGEPHDDVVQPLADNRERLESLAEALFRTETLEGREGSIDTFEVLKERALTSGHVAAAPRRPGSGAGSLDPRA